MSEESDCSEDENSMIMHVLPWHSHGQYYWLVKNLSILLMKNFQCNKYYYFNSQLIINSCINWMSAIYEKKVKKQGMLMARTKRVHVTPSSSMPPIDAPTWTLSIEWRGM